MIGTLLERGEEGSATVLFCSFGERGKEVTYYFVSIGTAAVLLSKKKTGVLELFESWIEFLNVGLVWAFLIRPLFPTLPFFFFAPPSVCSCHSREGGGLFVVMTHLDDADYRSLSRPFKPSLLWRIRMYRTGRMVCTRSQMTLHQSTSRVETTSSLVLFLTGSVHILYDVTYPLFPTWFSLVCMTPKQFYKTHTEQTILFAAIPWCVCVCVCVCLFVCLSPFQSLIGASARIQSVFHEFSNVRIICNTCTGSSDTRYEYIHLFTVRARLYVVVYAPII